MKKLKVLLSNFSDENNLTDSVSIIYNKYKKYKENSNSSEIFENINNTSRVSDENLRNDLSQEEIKINNSNNKVVNILDEITSLYLKLYKLLENNSKILSDIYEKIDIQDTQFSVKKNKLLEIIKTLMKSIIIVFNSKYEDENLFSIFQNKHMKKKGYNLLYCKHGKNIPIYYVNSYRVRFGDQGLGKIVPYEENLDFKNEYYIGGKFTEVKTDEDIKRELKKAIKRINRLQDFFNTQYTIAGSIYNNLRILLD
jgi:hypothetical protein